MESKIMLFADIANNDAEYDVITIAKINHDKTIEILDSTTLNVKYNSYEERQAEFNKMVDKIAKQYDASDILKDGEFLEDSEFEKRNKVRKLATSWKPIIIGKGMSETALLKFKEEWEKYSHGSISLVSTADPDYGLDWGIENDDSIKSKIGVFGMDERREFMRQVLNIPTQTEKPEPVIKSIVLETVFKEPKGKSKFHK